MNAIGILGWGVDPNYDYHGPPKPTFLEVFMVNNLVFRWPKPLFFMVLGAHGRQYICPTHICPMICQILRSTKIG